MARAAQHTRQYNSLLAVSLGIISLCFIGTLLVLSQRQAEVKELQQNAKQIERIQQSMQPVLGRSCGILNSSNALRFLEIHPEHLGAAFGNGPAENSSDSSELYWTDSCRYSSTTNSTLYAEVFIDTYQDARLAEQALTRQLPLVGDIDSEQREGFDELYYSAGAWYGRKNAMVVRVSANKGNPASIRNDSEVLFDFVRSGL